MHQKKIYILLALTSVIVTILTFSYFANSTSKELDLYVNHLQEITNINDIILKDNIFDPYSLDFFSDESYTKYVSPDFSFDYIRYKPKDLVLLDSEYILNVGGRQKVRKTANEYLEKMAESFFQEFGVRLNVMSSFRSYEYQDGIKARGCSDYFCAKAGHSEHQSGLAVDFFEATNNKTFLSKPDLKKYFIWWRENAHKYGFHNTYQKGREIDGYAIEPWHWRFVGVDFATYLWENDMTFAEFFNTLQG